tara:strand:+ start:3391 stop:3651 length:261 start_codon:yes stop_codon:yes gene_type:complete
MFKLQTDRYKDMNKPKKAPVEDLKEVKAYKQKKKKKLPKENDMFDKNFIKGGEVAMGKKIKKPSKEDFFAIRKSCVSRTCKHGVKC